MNIPMALTHVCLLLIKFSSIIDKNSNSHLWMHIQGMIWKFPWHLRMIVYQLLYAVSPLWCLYEVIGDLKPKQDVNIIFTNVHVHYRIYQMQFYHSQTVTLGFETKAWWNPLYPGSCSCVNFWMWFHHCPSKTNHGQRS